MSFELTNAFAMFQELMNNVLKKYLDDFVIIYLDDILIYSNNEKNHEGHVKKILTKLEKWKLSLKPKKCSFHVGKIKYLGFLISQKQIQINPAKSQMIKKGKTSINVKKIQFFLDFANYNKKFIKNFSKKTAPLTNLTNKNKSGTGIKKKQQTFDSIKQTCINASILKIFDPERPIRMKTNASDLVIKTCLNQKYNKQ